MASKRKSQEEKNLRTLRDLASLPANKQCFDCNQRGPTYVNVTIGSFVCTSCSGLLRGLNPPHRLKSITMTTFTPEEIELIKNRGNKYCRYVWLGMLRPDDSDLSLSPPRDEQRIRDHMVQVYEKKKWHVEPDIALKKMQHEQLHSETQNTAATAAATPPMTASSKSKMLPHQTSAPEAKPTSAPLVIQNSQSQPLSLWPPTSTAPTSQSKGSLDLLAELSLDMYSPPSAPLPVTQVPLSQQQTQQSDTANGNFANFESVFNSNQLVLTSSPSLGPAAPSHTSSSSSAPPRRLYTPPVGWASFEDESSTTPSSAVNGSLMPRPLSLPTFSPTNPFSPPPTSTNTANGSQAWCFPVAVTANSTFPSVANTAQSTAASVFTQSPNLLTVSSSSSTAAAATSIPPPERYAALKDLDSLFHSPPSTTASIPSTTVSTVVASANPASALKNDAFIENFNDLVIAEKCMPQMLSTSPSNPFIAPSLNHQPAPLGVAPIANPWSSFPNSNTSVVTNPFQTRPAAPATLNPPAIVPAALNNRDMLLTTMATQNGISQFQNGSWPWGISTSTLPPSQKVVDQFTVSWPPAPAASVNPTSVPASTANPFIGAPSSSSNNPFL